MPTRVSWLIPVRDAAPWLGAAARSALAECGPDDELVVVDDASTDHPGEVLPRDPRVRLLPAKGRGLVAALETGRAACRGDYVARLDGDDEALPGRLDAQLAILESHPEVGAVGGRAEPIEPYGEGMRRDVERINGIEDLHAEILVEAPLFHPATTLRASALAAVGGWRELDGPEDYDLWLRLADAGWSLRAVAQPVVRLRDRPDRLTRTDPRYRRAAFLPLKQSFLSSRLGRTVAVWGGGHTSRPWLSWLETQPVTVVAVYDVFGGSTRRGVPRFPREAVVDGRFDTLIVAVGARGARGEIRAMLAAWRPDLVEGKDWWAVA